MEFNDLFGIVMGIVASSSSVVALALAWHCLEVRLFYERAKGRVTELYHDEKMPHQTTVVRFHDQVGREFDLAQAIQLQHELSHGKEVLVLYHPGNPNQAQVFFHRRGEMRLSLMLAFAAVFTLLTFGELFWSMFHLAE